jgi:hypothetical protein
VEVRELDTDINDPTAVAMADRLHGLIEEGR